MENRKREDSIWPGISFTVITLLFFTFGIYLLFTEPADLFGIALYVIALGMLIFLMYFTVYSSQYERTTEFLVHTYEIYDTETDSYLPRWAISTNVLYSSYIYNYHLKDYEVKCTQKTIDDYINNLSSYSEFTGKYYDGGFKSEQAAMGHIVSILKNWASNRKQATNVRVRNVRTVDTLSAADLIERFDKGEFKNYEDAQAEDNTGSKD